MWKKSPLMLVVDELDFKQIRGKIARVKFAEELGTMSKNRLRWITPVRGHMWGIHSLTLMISWCNLLRNTYNAHISIFETQMISKDQKHLAVKVYCNKAMFC